MGQIWLSAEISNLSQPASGHWYFTLKDDRAQVRCAMFRNSNRRVTFRPQNGQQVLVRASITLYEPRGDYQLIAESMQPAGDGLLQQQFEQLKQRLSAEGLFDQQFKQPLPAPAKRVGVITSASGAALHDILQVLQRRDPSLPIVIYPTSVQGAEAPMQIVRAIETANRRDECDVLIVGRGGGSLEDLWSFNDERVARAIFASRIPIVSAVGHETDVTIADFVADLRAPTPSAAAELVSRNQLELLRQLQSQQQRLEMAMDYYRRSASSSSPAFTTVYSSSIRICAWRASRRCCSSCSAGWKTACSNSCAWPPAAANAPSSGWRRCSRRAAFTATNSAYSSRNTACSRRWSGSSTPTASASAWPAASWRPSARWRRWRAATA